MKQKLEFLGLCLNAVNFVLIILGLFLPIPPIIIALVTGGSELIVVIRGIADWFKSKRNTKNT